MGRTPGGPRSAKGQGHLQARDPPLPSLPLLSSLTFLLLGFHCAPSTPTLLTACTLASAQISKAWPRMPRATSVESCPSPLMAFCTAPRSKSVPLLAGLCNGVIRASNDFTSEVCQRASHTAWHLLDLSQIMGMLIVSQLLTWLVNSSVGYAGKLGPGASRLGAAGSRLPTGL